MSLTTRSPGLTLLGAWLLSWAVVQRYGPPAAEPAVTLSPRQKGYHALVALLSLGLVGLGSALAVLAFIRLAEVIALPEYLVAFFAAALGTSLPELLVTVTALKRGQIDIAVGDVLGSSLVDATLSIGIGPLIAPVVVSADLAIRGATAAAGSTRRPS